MPRNNFRILEARTARREMKLCDVAIFMHVQHFKGGPIQVAGWLEYIRSDWKQYDTGYGIEVHTRAWQLELLKKSTRVAVP